jgi:hypothetical protein
MAEREAPECLDSGDASTCQSIPEPSANRKQERDGFLTFDSIGIGVASGGTGDQ